MRLSVQLPVKWAVDRDAAEHPGGDETAGAAGGEALPVFEAHETDGAEAGPGEEGGGRRLAVVLPAGGGRGVVVGGAGTGRG